MKNDDRSTVRSPLHRAWAWLMEDSAPADAPPKAAVAATSTIVATPPGAPAAPPDAGTPSAPPRGESDQDFSAFQSTPPPSTPVVASGRLRQRLGGTLFGLPAGIVVAVGAALLVLVIVVALVLRPGGGSGPVRLTTSGESPQGAAQPAGPPRGMPKPVEGRDEYQNAVAGQPGLLGYWRMDEASGVDVADERMRHSGRVTSRTTEYARTPGKHGNALQLNGKAWVLVGNGDNSMSPTDAWTVETWVRLSALPAAGAAPNLSEFMLVTNGELTGPTYAVSITDAGQIRVRTSLGTLLTLTTSKAALATGQWHYVAVTAQGGAGLVAVYIDGTEVESFKVAPGVFDVSPRDIYIGGSFGAVMLLNGALDEAAVYGTALPPDVIASRVKG